MRPEHIAAFGAIMEAEGYWSFSNDVSRAKEEHARAGHVWPPQQVTRRIGA